jgi:hypothetical protein
MASRTIRRLALAVAASLAALPALADPGPQPAQPPSPAFERLKSLAGDWAGTAAFGDQKMETKASIRVVSAGSAVMITTDPGTSHEMVTLIHRDDGALVATHYCAAQNQPRMKAIPAPDAARIVFEFFDGTNLRAYPAHMQRLALSFPSPDRHVQE